MTSPYIRGKAARYCANCSLSSCMESQCTDVCVAMAYGTRLSLTSALGLLSIRGRGWECTFLCMYIPHTLQTDYFTTHKGKSVWMTFSPMVNRIEDGFTVHNVHIASHNTLSIETNPHSHTAAWLTGKTAHCDGGQSAHTYIHHTCTAVSIVPQRKYKLIHCM